MDKQVLLISALAVACGSKHEGDPAAAAPLAAAPPAAAPPAAARPASLPHPAPASAGVWVVVPNLPLEVEVLPKTDNEPRDEFGTVMEFLVGSPVDESVEAARSRSRNSPVGFRRFVIDRATDDGWELVYERGKGDDNSYVVNVRRTIAGTLYACGVSVSTEQVARRLLHACRSMRSTR
jgi:hypothetical protein